MAPDVDGIDAKQMADRMAEEWAGRMAQRLQTLGLPEDEINENVHIIHTFTRISVELLVSEPDVPLPYAKKPFHMEMPHIQQVIELFLRGVNQVSKKLRDTGSPWAERKDVIEAVSWKIFNLAKLLVAVQNVPAPAFEKILKSHDDLKTMMKHASSELLRKHLAGEPDTPFPIDPAEFANIKKQMGGGNE